MVVRVIMTCMVMADVHRCFILWLGLAKMCDVQIARFTGHELQQRKSLQIRRNIRVHAVIFVTPKSASRPTAATGGRGRLGRCEAGTERENERGEGKFDGVINSGH